MTTTAHSFVSVRSERTALRYAPYVLLLLAFALLFAQPARLLVRDWWNDPEAGHGLLLAPLSLWLGWRAGLLRETRAQPWLGSIVLGGAVLLRYVSGLAAELFTMRLSMIFAAAGIVLFFWGWRQLTHWWLSFVLFMLSVPVPAVLTTALALPLQFRASAMGAWLLASRHVPVHLSGNIISLPGRQLFVTEACSGLRSLTALLSLGVLVGGLWLRSPVSRALIILAAIPVAMVVNSVRVFMTGFLVYYVSPSLGEGFMHLSEGWLLFVVAFGILSSFTWLTAQVENRFLSPRDPSHD
ncbi:MAG: exosortase/archaeosortase family protein [Gemmatimonadota bacterium]